MKDNFKPIYTIGHRNPDTDSICSAIGYAHLKQAMGENVVPARAGKVNAETRFVLDWFGVSAPKLITDLYPKVKDVMIESNVTAYPTHNLRELGQIMKKYKIKSVPVVEPAGNVLAGMVSVSDLAKLYFDELEMQDLSKAGVKYQDIIRVLDGALVCGQNISDVIGGNVRIAAGSTDTIKKIIQSGDVVLVGDRENAQLACLEQQIACLIVTGNTTVSDEVVSAASKRGSILITAPYDTYTCARLINQSIPVGMIMKKDVVTFKPTDLIGDIKAVIADTNFRTYPVVENGKLVGIINRDQLIVPEKEKIILVDHNERTQAVEGIEEAQIVEIIDHHRLGGLETGEPIFIRHEPVGSTATIVANMHWHRNINMPAHIAGLLLAAIISDTVLFKSPTATGKDRKTAEKLAEIAGLDLHDFGMKVLKAGASLADVSPNEILHNDLKEFQIGEYRMAVGQISVMDVSELISVQHQLITEMELLRTRESYDMVMLMLTNIIEEGTHLLYVGEPRSLLVKAFGAAGGDGNTLYLPGVMSRKKQVIPPLVMAAKE